jgi:hypothetical protein
MKNPHHWKKNLLCFGHLQISSFWIFSPSYSVFNDCKIYRLNRRHPYEVGRKQLHKKRLWMRNKQMVKNAHPMHPHNMKERNKIWPFFFFTIINLPHSLIKGACIRTKIVITLQFDLAFASWIFLFIVEGLGCVLEQKLEHSIFLLQIQKNWQQNAKTFQSFKTTTFIEIGTFHFLIANSKLIDKNLEKFTSLSKPQNWIFFQNCKFGIQFVKNWKNLPIFWNNKLG